MSINEQWFLNNLADFSDLKHKSNHEEWASVESRISNRKSNSNFDLEKDTSDKLLKNFKDLKDKLKDLEKQNRDLQHVIERKDDQIARLKTLEKQNIKKMFEISKQMKQLKNVNDDYKQKLIYAKDSIKDKKNLQQELDLIKLRFTEQKQALKRYQEQRKTVLEIGIIQKLQLEEKIKRAQSRNASDLSYIQQMQNEVSKAKETAIRLQAQLKKIQIKYDEEIYNKKWKNGNYEREHLQIEVKQLNEQLRIMSEKDNKQKQKRAILEKRVLELQESSGLWIVKAQTIDNENKTLCKKMKKMEKKFQENEYKMDQALADSVYWEDKFLKSCTIVEELINRVKRQLMGDVVALAKSCQYKLLKLKEDQKNCKNKKSPIKRSQSKTRSRSNAALATPTRKLFDHLIGQTQKKIMPLHEKNDNVLTQAKHNIQAPYQRQEILSKSSQYLFKPLSFQNSSQANTPANFEHTFKKTQNQQNTYKGLRNSSQNSMCHGGDQNNLQLRIRKQREQMQKKIREKLLYQKIEMASSSPQKYQLRSEYMKLMDI